MFDASCYETFLNNDLLPTFDFQISLTINCESTWPCLTTQNSVQAKICCRACVCVCVRACHTTHFNSPLQCTGEILYFMHIP